MAAPRFLVRLDLKNTTVDQRQQYSATGIYGLIYSGRAPWQAPVIEAIGSAPGLWLGALLCVLVIAERSAAGGEIEDESDGKCEHREQAHDAKEVLPPLVA